MKLPAICLVLFTLLFSIVQPAQALSRGDDGAAANQPMPNRQLELQADCTYNQTIADLLNETAIEQYTDWIEKLSGEEPVLVRNGFAQILTRHTSAMFKGQPFPAGYEYVLETSQKYIPLVSQIEEDPFQIYSSIYGWYTAKNLVITYPGFGPNANQVVVFSAHLDSTSTQSQTLAPGAEDNASGSASMLEAVRLLRYYKFDRTIKVIWFTGEEQGLVGSEAYVSDHSTLDYVADVNLDMFGYDSNQDRCFELHVGTMDASDVIGVCFQDVIQDYSLDLSYDYIEDGATGASDHASFWAVNVGAVEVLENYYIHNLPNGCVGQDRNPHYHQITDTIDKMYLPAAFDIHRAGLGTLAGLAGPLGRCFDSPPQVQAAKTSSGIQLTWDALPEAGNYRIYRATNGCDGTFQRVAETSEPGWLDTSVVGGTEYSYRVEAVSESGTCISSMSSCVTVPFIWRIILPVIIR